ncbi:MAG: DNA-protecting protein DprA [Candidatus Kerfeldbacteria bacterium]|nr:DNA-protecting protein DprA [Candidatus Kerfeldbacteria bacterium]
MNTLQTVTLADSNYPPLLKQLPQPPQQLYYAGDWTCTATPAIAVVGSRAMTDYGRRACTELVTGLVQYGFTIVSGLATGIDAVAHRTALTHAGKTIAVLANGLHPNRMFPTEHQSLAEHIVTAQGLLLSEYEPAVPARRHHFLARNRIIAGLSLGTIVIEARAKSGALMTAHYAMDYNREVFAVPGSIFSSRSAGTHHLIQYGAKLVYQLDDIISELGINPIAQLASPALQLSINQQAIIQAITAGDNRLEDIIQNTQQSTPEIMHHLTELEITGIVRRNIDSSYEISYR